MPEGVRKMHTLDEKYFTKIFNTFAYTPIPTHPQPIKLGIFFYHVKWPLPYPHRAGGVSRRHTCEEIVGGEALAGAEAVDGEGLIESDHRVDEEEQEGRGEGLRRHPWGQ